MYHRALVVIRC